MVLAGRTVLSCQYLSVDICNHRLGIHNHRLGIRNYRLGIPNCRVGIDRQLGLEE
jgi:hypothetical protein